jgi:hypothetical protein
MIDYIGLWHNTYLEGNERTLNSIRCLLRMKNAQYLI